MEIHMLPAGSGDCFFIRYSYEGKGYNIWIDGGIGRTYFEIKKKILEIKARNEIIDLLVITHIDADHIRGVLKFFADKSMDHKIINRVLFNSASAISKFFRTEIIAKYEMKMEDGDTACTFDEGITLEKVLLDLGLLEETPIMAEDLVELPGGMIKILSPDFDSLKKLNENWEKESSYGDVTCSVQKDFNIPLDVLKNRPFQVDLKLANQASIAFLLECEDKKVLMLADSNPDVIVTTLKVLGYCEKKQLSVDCVKISHHGSCKNTSDLLIKHLKCCTFLISSNRIDYPQKETLARIINWIPRPTFICNYEKRGILLPNEEERCQFEINRKVRL